MIDLSFKPVGPNTYVKWNAVLGIRTTITFDGGAGRGGKIHVKHEQPRIDLMLDLNVTQQNDFSGYRHKEMVQATRIPIVEHRKIMQKCGFQRGHGYDVKKFKQIVNDSDYRKFKTIPGKI